MSLRNRWWHALPLSLVNSVSDLFGSSKKKRRKVREKRARLRLEALEDRCLPSILTADIPLWQPLGPGPIINATNVDLDGDKNPGNHGGRADFDSRAVMAIAADPNDVKHVYVGTANGGIWETKTPTDPAPVWQPITDQFPSLAIASLAFSPLDNQVLYAGTGSFGALFQNIRNPGPGGPAFGVLKSENGGTDWDLLGQSTFGGVSWQLDGV